MQETELYPPVKAYLEALGFEVKAEVGACDVMAVRAGEPPLIVEFKTGFSLTLVHQAIARQRLTDTVYIAVPEGRGKPFQQSLKRMRMLCRRLGLGILTVAPSTATVRVRLEPAPFVPRKFARGTASLLKEFAARRGDPNIGGMAGARVTAYRQDAILIARHLGDAGACKGAAVAAATGVKRATRMMADDHYGWFLRVERGVYDLSDAGRRALEDTRRVAA